MKHRKIRDDWEIKIIKYYLHSIWNYPRFYYVLTLYNRKKYNKIKQSILKKKLTNINKIMDLWDCYKFFYRHWYAGQLRIKYYLYWNRIGLTQAEKLGLV